MQRRILPIALIAVLLFSLCNWNCTKFDTTDIGSDLLPAVDNVNTFADTLSIITTQGVYVPDSTIVGRTDDHAFGINTDPVFGNTNAAVYFQLKPTFYPFYFGNPGDTLFWPPDNFDGYDSVVLCLNYAGFYGDSSVPLQVQLKEVVDVPPYYYFRDSTTRLNNVTFAPNLGANVGFTPTTSIDVRRLGDTVHYSHGDGYSVNTIRIRLSDVYGKKLFRMDTLETSIKNGFRSDSLFRQFFNGLAVVPVSGNQLVYTNLTNVDTRLEVHYRKKFQGIYDTLISTLILNKDYIGTVTNPPSSTTNNVVRSNRPPLPSGDQEIYLQTSPGTYANLSIPALATLSNRIIHRAELIVEEIPDNSGTGGIFKEPNFLYVDLRDSGSVVKWKPIYHDLNTGDFYDPDYKNPNLIPFYPNNGVDYLYFGGYIRNKTDVFGNATHYYTFNISKYVQDIVTNHKTSYDMRLCAPFNFKYPQYSIFPINYGNNVALGRVKVGGGNNPNYKMKLRIIYSKL